MILRRPPIRPAVAADSPRVQELVQVNDLWVDGLDWSELQGWFVAEHKGQVVGAIQMLLGKPLGVMLYLVVDPLYHNTGIGYALAKFSEWVLCMNNSDGYVGFTDRDEFRAIATKYKATQIGDFTTFIKRIRQGTENENLQ